MEKKRNRDSIKGRKYESDHNMSLDEIAAIEGVCKQYISQILASALKKLQKPHILQMLKNY